jgi:hypothetical protein
MNKKYQRSDGGPMSANQRLLVSGLLGKFEAAARLGVRKRMVALLRQVDFSETHAALWVDTLLQDHESLRFWCN